MNVHMGIILRAILAVLISLAFSGCAIHGRSRAERPETSEARSHEKGQKKKKKKRKAVPRKKAKSQESASGEKKDRTPPPPPPISY